MIHASSERSAIVVGVELPEGFDHRQQLPPCYTVVALSFTQPVAEIRNHFLLTILNL